MILRTAMETMKATRVLVHGHSDHILNDTHILHNAQFLGRFCRHPSTSLCSRGSSHGSRAACGFDRHTHARLAATRTVLPQLAFESARQTTLDLHHVPKRREPGCVAPDPIPNSCARAGRRCAPRARPKPSRCNTRSPEALDGAPLKSR